MQPQVTHEAEIHRQHVRLKVPIGVEIDGTRFVADDWSMGGFGIAGPISSRRPGERFPVRIYFPFEDFEVSLRLDCQMIYALPDNTRFGCKFLALSEGQTSLFRYFVDAYLSGEIVAGGDILSVVGRDNTAAARARAELFSPFAAEEAAGRRLRRWIGFGVLAGLAAALALFLGTSFRETYLVVETDAATVEAPIYRLRSADAGSLEPVAGRGLLKRNDVVARVRAADGTVSQIVSPCDCVVNDWDVRPGDLVTPGEQVAILVAADQPLTVRATVPIEDALKLRVGQTAEITIPGREAPYLGQIERLDFRRRLSDEDKGPIRSVPVIIKPDKPLEFEDLGSIARVRFL